MTKQDSAPAGNLGHGHIEDGAVTASGGRSVITIAGQAQLYGCGERSQL